MRQLEDAIRDAIESGYYKDGDILPSLLDMAEGAGVSIIVSREAVARIAESGLVVPRRGVGCVVRSPKACSRGHVVLVTAELVDNRYIASICYALRTELIRAGYRVSHVSAVKEADGRRDYSQLDAILGSPSVTMAVALTECGDIGRRIAKAGVPVVVVDGVGIGGACSRSVVGRLPSDRFSPLHEFVAHCVRSRVRHVTEVTCDKAAAYAVSALRAAGVAADEWNCPIVRRAPGENCVEPQVFEAMRRHCRRRRGRFRGELFFFGDDIAARAALVAFLVEGVRVPGDVRVATWCVHGFEPLSAVPLTRLETDPCALGGAYAKYVLELLRGNSPQECKIVGNRYIIGETFPA